MTTKTSRVSKKSKTDVPAPVAPATTPAPALPPVLALRELIPTLPEGFKEPVHLAAFVEAFRATHTLPTGTREERSAARDAILKSLDASLPGTPEPKAKHSGRFSGLSVFESQNAIYLAAALANVPVTEGLIMAFWRAELPKAKCDYLGKDYAWSTLSAYLAGDHGGSTIEGANEVVRAWAKRGRKPLAA